MVGIIKRIEVERYFHGEGRVGGCGGGNSRKKSAI